MRHMLDKNDEVLCVYYLLYILFINDRVWWIYMFVYTLYKLSMSVYGYVLYESVRCCIDHMFGWPQGR